MDEDDFHVHRRLESGDEVRREDVPPESPLVLRGRLSPALSTSALGHWL